MNASVKTNAQFVTEIDERHGSVKDIEGSQLVDSGDAFLSKLDISRYCLRLHNSCTI